MKTVAEHIAEVEPAPQAKKPLYYGDGGHWSLRAMRDRQTGYALAESLESFLND